MMNCDVHRCIAESLSASKGPNGLPKLIHQTWKTAKVPEHWSAAQRSWRGLHPSWTYVLWTDADIEAYIRARHGPAWALFEALPWAIQRVDLWRYFVLRDFGGLYVDLDIMATQSVEPYAHLARGSIQLVPSANTPSAFTNALMLSDTSSLAHEFWTACIAHVEAYASARSLSFFSAISRHMEIMESTGPLALTHVAREGRWPITVLPRVVWNAHDLSVAEHLDEQREPFAITKLMPGSSWHATDSTVLSFVHTHKRLLMALLCLLMAWYILRSELLRERFKSLRHSFRTKWHNK